MDSTQLNGRVFDLSNGAPTWLSGSQVAVHSLKFDNFLCSLTFGPAPLTVSIHPPWAPPWASPKCRASRASRRSRPCNPAKRHDRAAQSRSVPGQSAAGRGGAARDRADKQPAVPWLCLGCPVSQRYPDTELPIIRAHSPSLLLHHTRRKQGCFARLGPDVTLLGVTAKLTLNQIQVFLGICAKDA